VDTATIVALFGIMASGAAILTFWMRFSDRITKADGKAQAAREIAEEAKKDAHEANEKLALMSATFALYREQVAKEYIHREVMREVEDRLTAAIDRLGARFDRLLEKQVAT
jgi:hypothetical protein